MHNLLAQASYDFTTSTSSSSTGVATVPFILITLVIAVFAVAGAWKVYQKAGKPGWAAIVPVYNLWVLFEIVGMPAWLSLLSLIPGINIISAIAAIIAYFKLAKLFGKGDGFAILLVLFPFITMPILGFGKAQFNGTAAAMGSAPAVPSDGTPLPPAPPTVTDVPPAPPAAPTPPTPPTEPTPPVSPTPGV